MSEEKKKTNLHELVANSLSLAAMIAESGGELSPEVENALSVNEKSLAEKLDTYAFIEDQLKSQAEAMKAKAAEFREMAGRFELARDRLRSRIKDAMGALGTSEIDGNEYRYKLTVMPNKLAINESELPKIYKKITVSYEPDKEFITNMLKTGEVIPGVTFEDVVQLRRYVSKKGK
jgi:hypothetical protein